MNKIYGINSYIGIASKDGSITEAENIFFKNVKLPFLSYIKKNEYKKSIVYLTNVKLSNYLIDYLNDKYSQIYVNEKLVGKENEFILPIVYKKNLNLLKL